MPAHDSLNHLQGRKSAESRQKVGGKSAESRRKDLLRTGRILPQLALAPMVFFSVWWFAMHPTWICWAMCRWLAGSLSIRPLPVAFSWFPCVIVHLGRRKVGGKSAEGFSGKSLQVAGFSAPRPPYTLYTPAAGTDRCRHRRCPATDV